MNNKFDISIEAQFNRLLKAWESIGGEYKHHRPVVTKKLARLTDCPFSLFENDDKYSPELTEDQIEIIREYNSLVKANETYRFNRKNFLVKIKDNDRKIKDIIKKIDWVHLDIDGNPIICLNCGNTEFIYKDLSVDFEALCCRRCGELTKFCD